MNSLKVTVVAVLFWGAALACGGCGQPSSSSAVAGAQLPRPRTSGGMPLMQALKNRQTSRQFAPRALPAQVLSDLLWAADGVNRADGRRTAPSARNWQEVDIYVARADGLWLFEAKAHDLKLVVAQDLRALAGKQEFVKDAPATLIYVADFAKIGKDTPDADKVFLSAADTGFISQNVYLFCASEGLATGVRAMIDKPALAKAMGLRGDQQITLAQSVGYPGAPEKH